MEGLETIQSCRAGGKYVRNEAEEDCTLEGYRDTAVTTTMTGTKSVSF